MTSRPGPRTADLLGGLLHCADLGLAKIELGDWHHYATFDPDGLYHPSGWVPYCDLDDVVACSPDLFDRWADTFPALIDQERYVFTVAWLAVLTQRAGNDLTPAATGDPEQLLARLLPGGLNMLSRVAVDATNPLGPPRRYQTDSTGHRAAVAEVGLELSWSGYTGTIVEIRADSVLLQLLAGPALVVPDGDKVTICGGLMTLLVEPDETELT